MRKQYHHGDLKNALIRAGAELLASEGLPGLTLRRAALRAGVSHSAPYAHFADKQTLVTAISTEGLRVIREQIEEATRRRHLRDPRKRLEAAAWATVQFGLEQPALYRVTFSSAIEKEESDYPAYQEAARLGFESLVRLVEGCQAAGVLDPGPAEEAVVGIWSLVHGLVSLLLGRQVPQRLLRRTPPRRLLHHILASHFRVPSMAAGARRTTHRATAGSGRRATGRAGRRPR